MRIYRYSKRDERSRGFTLLELLVVMAILGFTTILALQTWSEWLPRVRLQRAARELVQVVQRARVTAIQRGVPAVVGADPTSGEVLAFADVEGDPTMGSPDYPSYLAFLPDSNIPGRRTDYQIAAFELRQVAFGGPIDGPHGADSVTGLTTVPSAPPGSSPVLVFDSNGTPMAGGGFRLIDPEARNVLEVAVEEVTGRVTLRKFLQAGDAPGGVAGFYDDARTAGGRLWVWY